MQQNIAEKAAFFFYDLVWKLAVPLLRRNQRLAEGFEDRRLRHSIPERANLWIQAASAGEAYLAGSLIKNLKPANQVNILLTSNTRQGMDILKQAVDDITPNDRGLKAQTAYFPFDAPSVMEKAVRHIRPEVMVLLESEIWPGLLFALKRYGCNVLIINGRLADKSLKRYLIWPRLWRSLRPDKVLAVSEDDAKRFALLFGKQGVEIMPNIKFDRISDSLSSVNNPLREILPSNIPFLILGSVGDDEESLIEKTILHIHSSRPDIVIGLFPRHIHRTEHWKITLNRIGIRWTLRSELPECRNSFFVVNPECKNSFFANGTVILWDRFGELSLAYRLAKAAYVGGSLVPLGGQNFLEPLIAGIVPVIGPYWEAFAWVGNEIMEQGLVRVAADWKEVAEILLRQLETSPRTEDIRALSLEYLRTRQGGTARSCALIAEFLDF
jgi:3-deoxy-D-manno-octulosonic-acid transferase